MCFIAAPVLAALQLATAVGGALVAYQGQRNVAKGQELQNLLARNTFDQEEALGQQDLARQRQEEYEHQADEVNKYAASARRDQATFDALLGESGEGNTAQRRLSVLGITQGQDFATLTSNANRVNSEAGYQSAALTTQRNQKVASLRAPDKVSGFGTALTIAGHGLTYAKTMQSLKKSGMG